MISPTEMKALSKPNNNPNEGLFDDFGEFQTPLGQIPLSRLLNVPNKSFKHNAKDKDLLYSLYTLQCPDSSQWRKPFIRLVSNHHYDKKNESVSIKIFVFFTRLIFELIADPSIKHVIDNIKNVPAHIVPVQTKRPQPKMFKSFVYDRAVEDELKFSLPGLK